MPLALLVLTSIQLALIKARNDKNIAIIVVFSRAFEAVYLLYCCPVNKHHLFGGGIDFSDKLEVSMDHPVLEAIIGKLRLSGGAGRRDISI